MVARSFQKVSSLEKQLKPYYSSHSMNQLTKRLKQLNLLLFGLVLSGPVFPVDTAFYALPELTIGKSRGLMWQAGDPWEAHTGQLINLKKEKQQSSIAEVLRGQPSIQVPRHGLGAPPVFQMRGMEGSETRVFLEDIPLTEPVFSSQNIGLVPALAVGQVEINGDFVPSSLLSDGLSGAINLRVFDNLPQDKFLATLGSYGFVEAAASTSLNAPLKVDLEYAQSNENFSYLDNNGTPFNLDDDSFKTRDHNGFKKASFLPSGKWKIGNKTELSLFSLNALQELQIPGPVQVLQKFQLREFSHLSALQSKSELTENLRLDSAAYGRFQSDALKEKGATEEIRGVQDKSSKSFTGGGRTALLWKVGRGGGRLALGSSFSQHEVQEQKNRNLFGKQWELPASFSGNFWVNDQWECLPSLLASQINYQSSSFSDTQFEVSPRVSTHFYFNPEFRTRASFGKFFRFPTLSEKIGNLKGVDANPELTSENALKAEWGVDLKQTSQGIISGREFTYSVFWAVAENLISFSQSSLNSKRAENIGRATWIGQEIVYKLNIDGFAVAPSVQWLWTENQSELESEKGKKLPNRFPLTAKIETSWTGRKWGVGYRGQYFSTSYLDRANQRELAAYSIHDIFAQFQSPEVGKIQFQVQNLFNLTLANSSWAGVEVKESITGISGYPDAGRRLSLSWSYAL